MSFKIVLILILLAKIQNASFIGILSTATEVVSFGIDVYKFMDDLLSEETKPTTSATENDQIISKILDRIQMSTESIVFNVELESHLSDLRDIAYGIKQLLSDMGNIITEQNKMKRKVYQSRFYDNFQRLKNDVFKIQYLLSFKIEVSGISSTLLSLVTKEFDCGITRLEEFQAYYMTLLSDAVALDLLNERISETDLHKDKLKMWENSSEILIGDFEQQKEVCTLKFSQLAGKYFEYFQNAKDLFESNQLRFPYKVSDVHSLSGTYCIQSLKDYESVFMKKNNTHKTIAFFTDKDNETKASFKRLDKLRPFITFGDCKTDSKSMISVFDLLGYEFLLLIMYPERQESDVQSFLDKDSNVIDVEVGLYRAHLYVRQKKANTTLHANNYEIDFNMSQNRLEDDKRPSWFWPAIGGGSGGGSVLIGVCICYKIYRCRKH